MATDKDDPDRTEAGRAGKETMTTRKDGLGNEIPDDNFENELNMNPNYRDHYSDEFKLENRRMGQGAQRDHAPIW